MDSDEPRFKNFERYQKIWHQNLQQFETVRNKMNSQALCRNYKANKQQADKGDLTILDRIDHVAEESRNRELLQVAFRPEVDHNQGWYCSLRQYEHDNEFDGM